MSDDCCAEINVSLNDASITVDVNQVSLTTSVGQASLSVSVNDVSLTTNVDEAVINVSANVIGTPLSNESITGASLSGSDGDTGRTFTAAGPVSSLFGDLQFMRPSVDYTTSGVVITFLIRVRNAMNINIYTQ